LLTVALAGVSTTLAWLAIRATSGVDDLGAVAAVGLIAIGLGTTLGAFRGRSVVLIPLGVALVLPLAIASFVGAKLQLGDDDPGALKAGAPDRTYVLGRGAGPVIVGRDVARGLRRLTIRKAAGKIDVRIAPEVPVRLTTAGLGGSGYVIDYGNNLYATMPRPGARTITLPATGKARQKRTPLEVRIETANAFVQVGHSASDFQRAVAVDPIASQRTNLRNDLALRQARLQARYRVGASRLSVAPVEVRPGVLTLREETFRAGASGPAVRSRDAALASLDGLQELRFDVLRAAWRVNSVARGIADTKRRLATFDRISTPVPKPRKGLASGPDARPTPAPPPTPRPAPKPPVAPPPPPSVTIRPAPPTKERP
jgi:hypothetical protein